MARTQLTVSVDMTDALAAADEFGLLYDRHGHRLTNFRRERIFRMLSDRDFVEIRFSRDPTMFTAIPSPEMNACLSDLRALNNG